LLGRGWAARILVSRHRSVRYTRGVASFNLHLLYRPSPSCSLLFFFFFRFPSFLFLLCFCAVRGSGGCGLSLFTFLHCLLYILPGHCHIFFLHALTNKGRWLRGRVGGRRGAARFAIFRGCWACGRTIKLTKKYHPRVKLRGGCLFAGAFLHLLRWLSPTSLPPLSCDTRTTYQTIVGGYLGGGELRAALVGAMSLCSVL